jgi:4-hydroxybenzoate polyprenyltransferase
VSKVNGLRLASHFGPTVIVTTISLTLSFFYTSWQNAIMIAFGVALGQLVVGWSNDLYDYADDLKHQRMNKPLVKGTITRELLMRCLIIMVPLSFLANLLGPLGINGGLVYMFGIACGVAYNLYFKFNIFSPLPYALAFAALPSSIVIAQEQTPPVWMWLGGALFGVAAHFVNVLKDIDEDQISGIGGLPQRLGMRNSIISAVVLIALGVIVLIALL